MNQHQCEVHATNKSEARPSGTREISVSLAWSLALPARQLLVVSTDVCLLQRVAIDPLASSSLTNPLGPLCRTHRQCLR